MTILVVDDEAHIRTIAAEALRRRGYEVCEAVDGADALRLLDTGIAVDLLITDVKMPGADGWAVARAYRDRFPDLPVLYVTGYYEERMAVAEAVILNKPFRPSQLQSVVRELIGTPDEYRQTRSG